ncbi:tripartite tricarboxylate transporter substrate binding protein [Rhizobium sp. TRM96647]|uniref:Bug family tripartite tricarboxylate transporter substrate binding protein n=1 Tax=unclassified Rhizobium TaxID=2613769 RepID=UPI0021E807E6|nr:MULTISPECIES: tripartite tricarboxylate transporter substrate binding protein [unclassified Rhizobium]MCV3735043.1 tripartite tricarboxylate transporter substrate binding protein [Rhizobium sp. TRM96647]MCV3757413.1 tripartite tricarboxylate transporter substrate binding protein [Rhizobium sp. TRM96650]
MRMKRFFTLAAFAASILAATSHAGRADEYPSKSVTVIVPFAAGGNTDALGRLVAEELDKRLGQRFIVENKPGAGGNIGLGDLARAEPDGYTIGMGTVSSNAINQTLYKTLPYDKEKGFVPLSLIATMPNVLVVNADKLPVNSVQELIELLKKEPGKHTYASSGVGTSIHLAGELLANKAGVTMTHVPYKGSSQAIMDVVAGHVDFMFDNIPTAAQQVKAGKLRALAVTSLDQASLLPDVPTMASVIPEFEATSWHGIFAPPGTPPEIVDKLSKEVQAILHDPAMKEKIEGMGATPVGNTSEEFAQFIDGETAKWAEVIKAANLPLQ